MKETTQNNILLAEFLDMLTTDSEGNIKEDVNSFKFHTSWNWLMPVVHRCLMIAHEEMLHEWENSFADVFLSASIDIMYKETVDFVKWYNENK